jgi:hypothetical protein
MLEPEETAKLSLILAAIQKYVVVLPEVMFDFHATNRRCRGYSYIFFGGGGGKKVDEMGLRRSM